MNMNHFQEDYLAAKAKTMVTIMNANGWKEGTINAESITEESVFFYVLDNQSDWVWCCSIPRESFYDVLAQSRRIDQNMSIAACSQLIGECTKNAEENVQNNSDKERELAMALTCYIGITKTYELTNNATTQNHFAVIRYAASNIIRPFAMGGPAKHLVGAKEIESLFQKVTEVDAKAHPEWQVKLKNQGGVSNKMR